MPAGKETQQLAGRKRTRRATKEADAAQQQVEERSTPVAAQAAVEQAKDEPKAKLRPKKKRQRVDVEVKAEEAEAAPGREDKENQDQAAKDAGQKMEALESDDYFEVLGLVRGCAEADVKRAYRKLAVQWHPDKNRSHPKAEEYFKKIGEAYAVLADPDKRAVYEKYGKAGLEAGAGTEDTGFYPDGDAYHDHFGFGGRAGFSARHARDIFDAFFRGTDPFAELFGGGQRQRQSSRRQRSGFGFGMDDDMGGFGGFGSMMGMGFGGGGGMASMMGSFFGDGFGADAGGFMSSSSFSNFGSSGGGGGSFSSTSVSSSSFTDQNGHVVTKKTTTTVDASGRSETVTEEFRNGKLVNSTSSAGTSRLAGAGRMQLESASVANNASLPPSSTTGAASSGEYQTSRHWSSSSRSRPRY